MKVYRTGQYIRPDLQAHIYSADLIHNVNSLRSLCGPKTRFCGVVKANAYGHGITEIVNILKRANVDFFAVATFYEALHIHPMLDRNSSVLILEPLNPSNTFEQIQLCADKQFDCVISSVDCLNYVAEALAGTRHKIKLHINIETGMGRCGTDPEQAGQILDIITGNPNLRLRGVYTHFATADEQELSYAYEQLDRFNQFIETYRIRERGDVLIHASNSAATIKIPQAHFDLVRCGISMYGYYSRLMDEPPIQLRPALKLLAPITQIKTLPAGHSVSYGRSFIPTRDTVAAIIPLGYADGYRRSFSNCAKMKIGNHFAPVIGRVCMDQVIIDITDIPNTQLGQMVTVLDNDHRSPCGAYQLAELADTICYEILTLIHAHVNRIVH